MASRRIFGIEFDAKVEDLFVSQKPFHSFRPLDQAKMGIKIVFNTNAFPGRDSVEVGVKDGRMRGIVLEEVERRATDFTHPTESSEESAGESRLACSKIAVKVNNVALFKLACHLSAKKPHGGFVGDGPTLGFDHGNRVPGY